jgi:hypothetical protein
MTKTGISSHNYLIIGGAPKAGTTSLFQYLSQHPGICPATVKEPNFFTDPDDRIRGACPFYLGLDRYQMLFASCKPDLIRMEASPHYIYSKGTPLRIHKALPNAKLVFLLREPMSLLFSLYRYWQQIGIVSVSLDYNVFVNDQFERIKQPGAKLHKIALSMGRYSMFLEPYLDLFGPDRILVQFFEEMIENQGAVVRTICNFVGISPDCCDQFEYKCYNPTVRPRSQLLNRWYDHLHMALNKLTFDKPRLHEQLKRAKHAIDPLFRSINRHRGQHSLYNISDEVRLKLLTYYHNEAFALHSMVGITVPWTRLDR